MLCLVLAGDSLVQNSQIFNISLNWNLVPNSANQIFLIWKLLIFQTTIVLLYIKHEGIYDFTIPVYKFVSFYV